MKKNGSVHSITVTVSRPRTFAKASTSDIRRKYTKQKVSDKVITKPLDATTRLYSLPRNQPIPSKLFKEDVSLLSYRLFAKKQESISKRLKKAIKLHDKYKIVNTDLRNRLHVQNPPDNVKTVKDIDDCYFRYIKNNTKNRYVPLFKSLQFEFHYRLRIRQEIGYKQDKILNIEQNYRREQEKYENSVKRYKEQVKHLDEFVAKDYQRAMAILNKCETLTAKLNRELSLRESLAHKQFAIQSRLIGLDYLYFIQQKYGRFLYYLSPPSWRAKNREFAHSVEIEAKGFDLGSSSEEDTFNVIFHNMQNECYCGLVKPVLYFSQPDLLINVFEGIAKQHLNHFVHVIPLTPQALKLEKSTAQLKNDIEDDTALVAELIEDFLKHVSFCEKREARLQVRFMQILYGMFYDTVAATDVLKLKIYLEFCYEKLHGEISFNLNIVMMAKALESMYMDYSFKLDAFTNDKIRLAVKLCMEKEDKKIRQAYIAATELRRFHTLEHTLLRAYEKRYTSKGPTANDFVKLPPVQKTKRRRQPVKPRVSCRQFSLTEAEIEYLHLFTDWSHDEDPFNYLHSLSASDRIP